MSYYYNLDLMGSAGGKLRGGGKLQGSNKKPKYYCAPLNYEPIFQ